MSRDLYVSALDLDAFQRVQGSGDGELLRRIADERSRMIEAHDAFFRRAGIPNVIPLMTAVARIVEGTVDRDAAPSPQYEHAAALLADTLGEPVDDDMVREVVPDFYIEVDDAIRLRARSATLPPGKWPALGDVMCRGPLLDVPLDPAARLGTGYLTAGEVRDALDGAECVDLGDEAGLDELTAPEDALEIASAYREWLRAAAHRRVGLFFHY